MNRRGLWRAAEVGAFGSTRPSRADIQKAMFGREPSPAASDVWGVPRGTAIHVVACEGDEPSEVFFLGYSFD